MDTVPGDKFSITTEQMLRLAPMISPVMHKVDVTVHFFFVPNRILWPNWEKFITGGQDPDTVPAVPTSSVETYATGTLADYMGVPTGVEIRGGDVSALPFAAYTKIYNEYYRDQNLVPEIDTTLADGIAYRPDLYVLRKRAWEHDYFTSALPWAQKGSAVSIPIGTFNDVPVTHNGDISTVFSSDPLTAGTLKNTTTGNSGQMQDVNGEYVKITGLTADTSSLAGTPTTINDLRKAFKLQEWLEKNARGGSRYIESMLVHFGVKSSDARLQRPEYLGGNKNPIVISEVLQTAEGTETPQGNMAGHGIGVGQSKSITYRCEEHGYIMGIMSVMPKTAYQQGVPRHFLRSNREDYYWPTFAHLGEQPILNKELFYTQDDGLNDDVFGYTPRYAEYKYVPSRVAGDFKDSLAFWHMGRIFTGRPNLNANFVSADPTHRIFAVEDPIDAKIYAHVYNRIFANRKMPMFGTPTL